MFREDRTYDTPIGKLPSVTTILGIIKKPYMEAWIKKTAREATINAVWEWLTNTNKIVLDNGKTYFDFSTCKDELIKIITESVKAHEKVAQKALDIGSFVHDVTDSFHKSKDTINNLIKQTEEKLQLKLSKNEIKTAKKMIETYLKVLEIEKIEVVYSEMIVWHELGYAGTLDRVARVDGRLAIVDLKTSKKYGSGKYIVPMDYKCQIEAYRQAYLADLARNISYIPFETIPFKRYLFRLDKENPETYDFINLDKEQDTREQDWKLFLAHKLIYDAQRTLKSK